MLNAEKTSAYECGSLFAIVDKRMPEKQRIAISALGFSVICLEPSASLPEAMASHTDMLLFECKGQLIGSSSYFSKNNDIKEKIEKAKGSPILLCDIEFGKRYPEDARLNALVIGDKLFCKSDTAAEAVKSLSENAGLKTVPVKQGYPACTTLAVGEHFAVTSDLGMAKALRDEEIEVMTVPESDAILLPPYKNGFIGGCTAVYKNKIFFFGNAKVLSYYDVLAEKLLSLGYEIISLDGESHSLLDLGGAVFIEKGL